MVDSDIVKYIRKRRGLGKTDKEIRESLDDAGHGKKDIEDAFTAAKKSAKKRRWAVIALGVLLALVAVYAIMIQHPSMLSSLQSPEPAPASPAQELPPANTSSGAEEIRVAAVQARDASLCAQIEDMVPRQRCEIQVEEVQNCLEYESQEVQEDCLEEYDE